MQQALGYQGILDIGYRYDARDGKYKVLDVNPRIGGTFRLFVDANGMDVARALYLDMTGQAVACAACSEGRKWVVEDRDIESSYWYWRDGQLGFREWASSFRGLREAACENQFRATGPYESPAIHAAHYLSKHRLVTAGSEPLLRFWSLEDDALAVLRSIELRRRRGAAEQVERPERAGACVGQRHRARRARLADRDLAEVDAPAATDADGELERRSHFEKRQFSA